MMFLRLKNAVIGYDFPLISEVHLSLERGEMCLLVGNNGVGKTSLMKSILGQNSLLGGEIFIDEKSIKDYFSQELAQKIAVVFSKAEVPKNYKVWDLLALGKYIHYPYYFRLTKEDEKAVAEVIEKLNLEQYQSYSLSELSDGNLQKVFIGRALVQDTPMILLDEPTTHLDEDNKIMILKLLQNIAQEERKLILFSSHDWRLAKDFSSKIWWVKDRIIRVGDLRGQEASPILSMEEVLNFVK